MYKRKKKNAGELKRKKIMIIIHTSKQNTIL